MAASSDEVAGRLLLQLSRSDHENAAQLVQDILGRHRVSPDLCDAAGATALFLASKAGQAKVVSALLAAGARPELSTHENKNPPLFWAAGLGHLEVVRLLLDFGADPLQRNVNADSALLWACRTGQRDCVAVLLRARPDAITHTNVNQTTCLHCAAAGRHPLLLQELLERVSNMPPIIGSSRGAAAEADTPRDPAGDAEWAGGGTSPLIDARDTVGRTPLHYAAGCPECVRALLSAGASLSLRDEDGLSALQEAKSMGCEGSAAAMESAWRERDLRLPLWGEPESTSTPVLGKQPPRHAKRTPQRQKVTDENGDRADDKLDRGEDVGDDDGADCDAVSTDSDDDDAPPEMDFGGMDSGAATDRDREVQVATNIAIESESGKGVAEAVGWVQVGRRGRPVASVAQTATEEAVSVYADRLRRGQQPAMSAEEAKRSEASTAPVSASLERGESPPQQLTWAKPTTWAQPPNSAQWHIAERQAVTARHPPPNPTPTPSQEASKLPSGNGDEEWGELHAVWYAWHRFREREPEVVSTDLQLRHFLGAGIGELSMSQIETLQRVQRGLALELEEWRVRRARVQEREAVEARLALDLERLGLKMN